MHPDTSHTVYIEQCCQRVPAFVAGNYHLLPAWHLNRKALGKDLLIAPINFLLAFPNFLIQLLGYILKVCRMPKAARFCAAFHLGFSTRVHEVLRQRLLTELMALPGQTGPTDDPRTRRRQIAAHLPIRTYLQTRHIAADLTTGTLLALFGLLALRDFTPGSISAGAVLAEKWAREQAISAFPLGETLGGLVYSVVPVSPSPITLTGVILVLMLLLALISAFSGFIHDPLQSALGIHQRRLQHMLAAIDADLQGSEDATYRPKDTFVARVYDLIDWIKGLFSLW